MNYIKNRKNIDGIAREENEFQFPDTACRIITRESNEVAIDFYKKLGFCLDGKFEKSISNHTNEFEAYIPMAWFNKNFINKG